MRIAAAYVAWFLPCALGMHAFLTTRTCPNFCSLSPTISTTFSEQVTGGEKAGVRGRDLNGTDFRSLARRVSEGFPETNLFRSSSLTLRVGGSKTDPKDFRSLGRLRKSLGTRSLAALLLSSIQQPEASARAERREDCHLESPAPLQSSRFLLRAELSLNIERRTPSLTRRVGEVRVIGHELPCGPLTLALSPATDSVLLGHAKCGGEGTRGEPLHSLPSEQPNPSNTLQSCRAADDRPPPAPSAERLPLHRYEYDFVAMGMKYHLVVYAPDERTVARALEQVEARVRQIDRVMSDYHTESELSQLCDHSRRGQPVRLSPELYEVLDHSLELSRETGGAFDVTVGPVIQLWRTARRTKTLPPPDLLKQARERVGWEAVHLDPLSRSAELTRDGMQLDLGGIAAGYACDEAMQILRSHGLPRVLIDASGDVLVGDPPPDRDGWKVTVAGLSGGATDLGSRTIMLSNAAITTSGDARQFVEIEGQRYSHIVDPKTGLGLTRRSSTTVIAPTGWQADSYATAVNVLGSKAGMTWLETHPGCSALIVEMQDGVEVRSQSLSFPSVMP